MTRGITFPETVTLHVPFRVLKRGGRKAMQLPEGDKRLHRTDNTLIKALARAFRWKRMLESGEYATVGDKGHTPLRWRRAFRARWFFVLGGAFVAPGRNGWSGTRTWKTRNKNARVPDASDLIVWKADEVT